MARRHGRDIYTARNPHWQRQPPMTCADTATYDDLRASMRSVYAQCSRGEGMPAVAVMSGAIVNQALNTTDYDPECAYLVSDGGIRPLD